MSSVATEAPNVVPVVRDEQGRFPAGVSGNPAGRPKGTKNQITALQQELDLAIRQHLKPAKLQAIVSKMADLAESGDKKAAKLIFDSFISKAGSLAEEDEGNSGRKVVVFRVENATFAVAQEHPAKPDAIDVEVTSYPEDSPTPIEQDK